MPDDGNAAAERLVILLEAKINDLEKNMAKASGTTAKAYRQMSLGSKKATQQMESDMIRSTLRINQALAATSTKIGAFSKSFVGGAIAPVAGLLTLTAAINGTKNALDKLGDINDKSIAAGLDPEFFQSIAYQAKLSGVEIDGVASALSTFAKNAGLAAEGKGRMVATLQALNPELLKSIILAGTQEQRVKLVADAIKNAKDQAQAAAIATAAFGDSGVQLVAAFKGGAEEIDRMVAKAKEMGLVFDRDLVEHADELGDKFDTLTQIVDVQLKSALVDLGPTLVSLIGLTAEWLKDLAIVIDQFRDIEDRAFVRPLQNQLVDIENRMAALKQQTGNATGGGYTTDAEGHIVPTNPMGASPDPGAQAEYSRLQQEALELQNRIAELQGMGVTPPSPPPPSGNTLDGLTKTKKAIVDNSNAVTELAKNWQTAEEMAQSFASTLVSDLVGGKGAIESVADALGNLGDQLIQMATNQAIQSLFGALSGGLVGGFGSIKGGAAIPLGGFVPGLTGPKLFAKGGVSSSPAIFGDSGPEAAVPLPDGRSIPVTLQGGGDAPSYIINNYITGSKPDAAYIASVTTSTMRQHLPAMIEKHQRNPWRTVS